MIGELSVWIKPFAIGFSLFEIKQASVDNFGKINIGVSGLIDLSIFIELLNNLFDLFSFKFRNEIAFVEEDDICKLDLLGKEVEHGSTVSLTFFGFILEDVSCDLPGIEISLKCTAVNYGDASIKFGKGV